jgi:hypothetical protein
VSYSVRGEEPVVIGTLKVGALPKGSSPRCGVPGAVLNAPKAYADPRSGVGEGDEAMTIKQYESI